MPNKKITNEPVISIILSIFILFGIFSIKVPIPYLDLIVTTATIEIVSAMPKEIRSAGKIPKYKKCRKLRKINKPVIIKRGMSAIINELLMTAEYLLSGARQNVILCERVGRISHSQRVLRSI